MQLGKSILVITIALIGVLIAILAENVHLPTFLTLFYIAIPVIIILAIIAGFMELTERTPLIGIFII